MSLPQAPSGTTAAVTPPGTYPQSQSGTISWADSTGGACGHRVYRRREGTNGPPEADHLHATTAPGVTSYFDAGPLLPQNRYVYYVRSFNDDGESERPLPATADEVYLIVRAYGPG